MRSPLTFERRAHARFPAREALGTTVVRIRPGHTGQLLDWSEGGVLVQLRTALRPGASVSIQFTGPLGGILQGSIVRSYVARIDDRGITYRGALAFVAASRRIREHATR